MQQNRLSSVSSFCFQTGVCERLLKPGWPDCSSLSRCCPFYYREAELNFPTSFASGACGRGFRRLHLTLNALIGGSHRTRMGLHTSWPIGFEKRWGLSGVGDRTWTSTLTITVLLIQYRRKTTTKNINQCTKNQYRYFYLMSIIYFIFWNT